MPRERIQHGKVFVIEQQDRDLPYLPSDDGKLCSLWVPGETIRQDQLLREEVSLDVHWSRNSEFVQISLDAPTDWWQRFHDSHKDDKEVISSAVFTDRLTRREINEMIKVLRRARDAAYGTDE